jgi:hypothetical protein
MRPSFSSLSLGLFLAITGVAAGCGDSVTPHQPDGKLASPDANTTPDSSNLVTIGNQTPVCQGSADVANEADIGPVLPDEIGDPALTRITPPSYPFKVTSVSYRLTGMQATCATNIAHSVTVYAAPAGTTPPAMPPAGAQKIAVAPTTDDHTLVVTEELPTPITLTTGEELFVAVEMTANTNKTVSICLDGCPITAEDSRAFWSEMPAPPFTWSTMWSFNIAMDFSVWAQGVPQ